MQLACGLHELDEIGRRLTTSLAPAMWEFNHKQIAQIVDSEMGNPVLSAITVIYGTDKA